MLRYVSVWGAYADILLPLLLSILAYISNNSKTIIHSYCPTVLPVFFFALTRSSISTSFVDPFPPLFPPHSLLDPQSVFGKEVPSDWFRSIIQQQLYLREGRKTSGRYIIDRDKCLYTCHIRGRDTINFFFFFWEIQQYN